MAEEIIIKNRKSLVWNADSAFHAIKSLIWTLSCPFNLQASGTVRMLPGPSCPRPSSLTASTSPSSATSSTHWPSRWRWTGTTPEKTSCGAQRAWNCTMACRMAQWWVWTTVSSGYWFSSSWTSRRLLQCSVLASLSPVLHYIGCWYGLNAFKEPDTADVKTSCPIVKWWIRCTHVSDYHPADCIFCKKIKHVFQVDAPMGLSVFTSKLFAFKIHICNQWRDILVNLQTLFTRNSWD